MTTSSIVARSARVLDAICASGTPLSFSRIVSLTGLPKSSAHRILSILMTEQLVAFQPDNQSYQPGGRLIGWATRAFGVGDLPGLCTNAMEKLSEITGAHIALSILDGSSVLFIKTVDSIEPFRLAPRVGERSPPHACAAGKMLLSLLSDVRRRTIVDELPMDRYTNHTITDRRALQRELIQARQNGYATCDREEFLHVAGISAPIFGHHGGAVAALSVWNLVARQDLDALLAYRDTLLSATKSLSERLGARAA